MLRTPWRYLLRCILIQHPVKRLYCRLFYIASYTNPGSQDPNSNFILNFFTARIIFLVTDLSAFSIKLHFLSLYHPISNSHLSLTQLFSHLPFCFASHHLFILVSAISPLYYILSFSLSPFYCFSHTLSLTASNILRVKYVSN